jgi:hypothetical protein
MAWPRVERVWLPEWLSDPDTVLDRLVQAAIDSVRDAPASRHPAASPASSAAQPSSPGALPFESSARTESAIASLMSVTVASPGDAAATGSTVAETPAAGRPALRQFTPWQVAIVGSRESLDDLPSVHAASVVWKQLAAILAAESPIAAERLARLGAAAFDLTRLNQKRIDSILAVVPRQNRDVHGFVWKSGTPHDSWPEVLAASDSNPRPLAEIHPRELVRAMVMIAGSAWEIATDELFAEVLRLYGWKRRTEAALRPVQLALDLALEWNMLTASDDGLVKAHPNAPSQLASDQ